MSASSSRGRKVNIIVAHVNNRRGNTYLFYEYFLFKHIAKSSNNILFISSYDVYHERTKSKLIRITDRELLSTLLILYSKKAVDKIIVFFEYGAYTLRALLALTIFGILFALQNKRRSLVIVYHGPFVDRDNIHMFKPGVYFIYKIFHKIMSKIAYLYVVFSTSHREKLARIGIRRTIVIPFGNYDYDDIQEIYRSCHENTATVKPPYALIFGIISPRKNIEHVVLSYIKHASKRIPLIVAGSVTKHIKFMHRSPILQLLSKKELLTLYNIHIIDKFIDDCTAINLIKNASVIIIPYLTDTTTSGVLAFALGLKKNVVVPASNGYFKDYVSEKCMFKGFTDIINMVELNSDKYICPKKFGYISISMVSKIFLKIIDII